MVGTQTVKHIESDSELPVPSVQDTNNSASTRGWPTTFTFYSLLIHGTIRNWRKVLFPLYHIPLEGTEMIETQDKSCDFLRSDDFAFDRYFLDFVSIL